MCGIAGYIGRDKLAEERVNRCLEAMKRRGPDDRGVYRNTTPDGRHVCLLHTRLSIIDLDKRSAQPMRRDGQVIAFNGELYNYREVRERLEKQGSLFHTRSDTEVLLASLVSDGLDGLDAMEGMWAFAKYDEADGSLLLCRDRFGEKPLSYFEDDTGLYFASEVKFLAALSGRRFTVNETKVRRFLVYGYRFLYKGDETFFNEVRRLPSHSYMRVGPDGAKTIARYWEPRQRVEPDMTYEEAVAGARERLIRSVELRLRSDVPLAFCMSGGVDSNSLISIAKRVFGYDVHGFTIANHDERYDEQDIVDAAVAEQGLKHTSIWVDPSGFLQNLRKVVNYHDSPVCTVNYYSHWQLMRSVAEHGYKVSVSGTAADELFTGYYDHHAMYLAAMHGTVEYAEALDNWNRHIRPIVRNPMLQDPEAFIKNPGLRAHLFQDAAYFSEILTEPFEEPFSEVAYTDSLLRNRMMNELFEEAVRPILHEDDHNAMYFSIENRSPFLDRSLFDFCFSIPTRHLIRDGFNKKVLRDAMRGIVPDVVADTRKKVGFNAPIFDYLDIRDPAVLEEVLADSPIFEIVRRDRIAELLQPGHMTNSFSKFLFSFISCKLFLEECA